MVWLTRIDYYYSGTILTEQLSAIATAMAKLQGSPQQPTCSVNAAAEINEKHYSRCIDRCRAK
jgi:hypothetical protein